MRRHAAPAVREIVRGASLLLCLGAVGVVWLLPAVRRHRRRRAATCPRCARNGRLAAIVLPVCAVLLLGGAVVRLQAALVPLTPCSVHVYADGRVVQEPPLQLDTPPGWSAVRQMVLADVSGLALAGSRTLGMDECFGAQPITFWRPPRTSSGGTVVGETFVAWNVVENGGRPSERDGFGITSEGVYLRFGPNISRGRREQNDLAQHESNHVDQAAVLSLAGGPVAMPVLYAADDALFPVERNHFEQAAGLAYGGYPQPSDGWPRPQWGIVGLFVVALVLLGWRRIRWWSRIAAGGRAAARRHVPQRCPRHSPGWFRAAAGSSRR